MAKREPSNADKKRWKEQDRITNVPDKKPERPKSAQQRERDRQHDKRRAENDNAAIAAAKKLDPKDQSDRAKWLREVAEDVEDHRSSRDTIR